MAASEETLFNEEEVHRLLNMGYDPNTLRDSRGRTMMHLAAIRGDIDVLEMLFDNGAEFSLTDRKGNTPLHTCLQPFIILFLVKKAGISPSARNYHGDTALVLAKRLGASVDVLEILRTLEKEEHGKKEMDLGAVRSMRTRNTRSLNVLYKTWNEFVQDLGMRGLFFLVLFLGVISFLVTYHLLVVEFKPEPIYVT